MNFQTCFRHSSVPEFLAKESYLSFSLFGQATDKLYHEPIKNVLVHVSGKGGTTWVTTGGTEEKGGGGSGIVAGERRGRMAKQAITDVYCSM